MDFKKFIDGALCRPEAGDKVEYFNLKARISGNVLTNAAYVPAGGYHYEVDITDFWSEFKALKSEVDYPLSFNTLMLRVLAEGLKVAPRLNSHLDFNERSGCGKLIVKKHIDVAVPIFMESGETFPVKLRHLEEKNLKEIYEEMERLQRMLKITDVDRVLFDVVAQRMVGYVLKGKIATAAAYIATGYVGKYKVAKLSGLFEHAPTDPTKSLQPYELNEGTVCLTNLGSISKGLPGNVTYAPLLYPQSFIMAISAVQEREVAFKNEKGKVDLATRKFLPINVMFDHRIGGFADVVPFIKRVNEIFENPKVIREW